MTSGSTTSKICTGTTSVCKMGRREKTAYSWIRKELSKKVL